MNPLQKAFSCLLEAIKLLSYSFFTLFVCPRFTYPCIQRMKMERCWNKRSSITINHSFDLSLFLFIRYLFPMMWGWWSSTHTKRKSSFSSKGFYLTGPPPPPPPKRRKEVCFSCLSFVVLKLTQGAHLQSGAESPGSTTELNWLVLFLLLEFEKPENAFLTLQT